MIKGKGKAHADADGDFKSSLADRLEARARTHARGEAGATLAGHGAVNRRVGLEDASVDGLRGIRP